MNKLLLQTSLLMILHKWKLFISSKTEWKIKTFLNFKVKSSYIFGIILLGINAERESFTVFSYLHSGIIP